MRKVWLIGVALAVAAVVAGCIETKQDCTLNPDGSGKAVIEVAVADMSMMMAPPDPSAPDPELALKQFAKGVLDKGEGVETWSDVSFGRTEDGRMRFKGTAYFKDFSQMKTQSGAAESVTFAKDDKGGMVLAMHRKGEAPPEAGAPPAAPPVPLTPEAAEARIKTERMKYQQMRPMLEMMLGKMKVEMAFRLPGAVAEVSGFQKAPDGTVQFAMDGAKFLQVMDELMADEAQLKQALQSGEGVSGGGPKMERLVMEKLFGSADPPRARVIGDLRPLFDYEAEVKAAKDAYPAMIERLGLDKVPAAPAGPPPGFGIPGTGPMPPTGRGAGGTGAPVK
jgi:hypothetical protein